MQPQATSTITDTKGLSNEAAAPPRAEQATSIATQMTFAASPEQVWSRLMFYEQIEARPPFPLSLLLPVPIRTVGRKSEVGDEATCLYEGGHLIKRITDVDPSRHYGFEVAEQRLEVRGGMKLMGGAYTLRPTPGGETEVVLLTRYSSPMRPRWLWRRIEATVCHAFHRHILRAMRRSLEPPVTPS